jgi:hypothetical protein
MKLRDIHGPVPGYKEKLEKSMDRFFEKLEVGRVVRRSNVSENAIFQISCPTPSNLFPKDDLEESKLIISCSGQ